MSSYVRFGFGLYLVELRDDTTPIGICGLVKREALEDVDIGFAFLPAFWSRGYALESAAAVMNTAGTSSGSGGSSRSSLQATSVQLASSGNSGWNSNA